MANSFHGILIHVVFSTHLRKPVIHRSWEADLWEYMGGIARDHKATLLKGGGVEDHVHLFLQTHPSFAIADTIKLIKANSSRWINENAKTPLKFQWQRGYAAFSVSQSRSDDVKKYIDGQREHHRVESFRTEYLRFLKRHNIPYDERYVFDEEIVG